MIGQIFGHYVVLEKIGAGGMGEVYRAHDQHLERDVALKLLPSGFLADEPSRRRFRREALALSKLNHPNIATIFDFDTQGDVDFLAMEFIQGTPLSDRLAGALGEKEVLDLGIQLAQGLAAAHAEGVIHRDLKPGNVMITQDGRVKILDFGLAVLVHHEGDLDVTRTAESAVISGTLPYMPPEQLRGQPTDARSDIYAAGAVLYEMATGTRPFPQSQSAELIGAILHESPPPPSSQQRRMTPGLEAIVMKSLRKEPAQRFQSARELLVALQVASTGAAQPQMRRRAVAAAGLGLVAILLAGLMIALNLDRLRQYLPQPGAVKAPVQARRSVAVLGFRNLSGRPEDAWLSTALSEMLTTELAVGEHLRTIAGENISQMKINLALADAETYGTDTLANIRANLGTDVIVLGSFVALGSEEIRLDVRLQDAVGGETLAAFSEKGNETRIDDLVNRAGATLRRRLGAGELSAADAVVVRATFPANPQAVRLYTEGLARLRKFDALNARNLLEKAVAADPSYSLAHAALAEAWSNLGYDEDARTEARRASELSTNLSREDRLFVEGRYQDALGERDKAIEIYRTLWNFFPDNVDYGLRLAAAQVSAGKGSAAVATVDALRSLSAPASADPRIDLAEAAAAGALDDYGRQQAAAERAAAKASAQGARLLLARSQLSAGDAMLLLGQPEKATLVYESARDIFSSAGDRGNAARATRAIGEVLRERGEILKAEEVNKAALALFRDIGDQRGAADSLWAIGSVRYRLNDLEAARQLFQESLKVRRDVKDLRGTASALNGLGVVLMDQKKTGESKKMFDEALAIYRDSGAKGGVATVLNNTALLLTGRFDFAAARPLAEEALSIRRGIGERGGIATALRNLGVVLWRQGELAGALKALEEALMIQREIGQKTQASYTQTHLAKVHIDAGQAARAESLTREAAEEMHREKIVEEEVTARSVLAHSLLVQGNVVDAQKAIAEAVRLMQANPNLPNRRLVITTAARIRSAAGETEQAARDLDRVLVDARKSRDLSDEFDARLLLGDIELRTGKTAVGRARLATLEKDATARGFLLLARQARATAGIRQP